ncbi:MAG: peptidase domain-containing ABC transporter [Moraxellaceae bacterium]|nr:peptidase domain-containing ABC transporter [Moraxellaceae bacterium]
MSDTTPNLLLSRLNFSGRPRLPVLLQTEAAECGLACLAMIAGHYGHHIDVATLRRRFPVSLQGSRLSDLLRIGGELGLATRPVKLALEDLNQLRLPCLLHWNFNHFVVLREVNRDHAIIHDPASGERRIPLAELGQAFTGVAAEMWPAAGFKPAARKPALSLRQLTGEVQGLRGWLGKILLLALTLELFALIGPLFMQWVLDNVVPAKDADLLTLLALGFALLLLMQQAITALRSWLILYFGTHLNIRWRANVFGHLIHLPVDYFSRRHLGDIASRFGSIDTIQDTLTTTFVEALLDGLMAVLVLVMMFLYAPKLAWISIGAVALYALLRALWYRPLRLAAEEEIVHAAKAQSHFLETVRGARAIKLFGRQEERRNAWLALLVDEVNAGLTTQRLGIVFGLLSGLIFGAENIAIIWLGAGMVISGQFTVGLLVAFIAYKSMFGSRVSGLIDKLVELAMLRLQAERLADIVLTPAENPASTALATERNTAPATIDVRRLRFRHGESEPWLFDGLDMHIQAGQSVAIVGPSGCGKSTLVNLLLGILKPEDGDIRVDGRSLQEADIESWRLRVGTVMQDDMLFAGSIADNISFFDPQADQDRIEDAARLADIHDDIMARPMRYNTLVGELGSVLSGGQKQRVLLARALYKQPSLLVLDEATSHLDLDCEERVNAAIASLAITRVIVAHRPETIASADIIFDLGLHRQRRVQA